VVTGGAGFVGGHFVHHISRLGVDVSVVDDLSSGRLENLPPQVISQSFTRGDVCNRSLLTEHDRHASHVIHFASVVGTKRVIQNPDAAIRTNVHAVSMIAEVCSVEQVPLVYVSSSAVYHNGGPPTTSPCEETSVTFSSGRHPASIYGMSKGLGELICESYRRSSGLRCLIVRPFNLIGIRQSSAYGMVVPTFVRRALEGLPLLVHGDGKQVRCFSDVRQAMGLLWNSIMKTDWAGEVVNLATDDYVTSVLELAGLVQETVGHRLTLEYVPHQSVYGENYIDVAYRRPSLESLRALVGAWTPVSLRQTIEEVVAFESERRKSLGSSSSVCAAAESELVPLA
jgi:UDP-glucose 4-epimerase